MRILVDKMPATPRDCPYYNCGGYCDIEQPYKCQYFQGGYPTQDDSDCFIFRTFSTQFTRELEHSTLSLNLNLPKELSK